jgi:hypothetical protein
MFTRGPKRSLNICTTEISTLAAAGIWLAALGAFTLPTIAQVLVPYPQGTNFPLMMYEVEPSSTAPTNTYFGWNVIQSYSVPTNATINPFLHTALTNEVCGDVVIPDLNSNGTIIAWSQSQVQSWIESLETNSNIAWWDLPEELLPWIPSEMQLLGNYTVWTRFYDSGRRPTYEYTENTMSGSEIATISSNVDIISISCYCEQLGMPHAWVRYKVHDAGIEGVAMAYETVGSNYLAGQKTITVDLYCATNSSGINATPAECYHDVWSSIASGAQGIALYSYYHAINDTPALRTNLLQYNLAASQISGPEQIGPMILYGTVDTNVNFIITSGPTNTVTFNPPGLSSGNLPPDLTSTNVSYSSLNVLCKIWSNKIYVIAVNSTSNTVSAIITNLPVASATAVLPFETNSVPISNNSLAAMFPAWGVHVYTIASPSPFLSAVTSAGGEVLLSCSGIQNFSYILQSSTNLVPGEGWANLATNTAPNSGLLTFTNNPAVGTIYYRLLVQ